MLVQLEGGGQQSLIKDEPNLTNVLRVLEPESRKEEDLKEKSLKEKVVTHSITTVSENRPVEQEKVDTVETPVGQPITPKPIEVEVKIENKSLQVEMQSWVKHLVTTLKTPMYSRGADSFVRFLKAEFALTTKEDLKEFQALEKKDSEIDNSLEKKKKSYWIDLSSLNESNIGEKHDKMSKLTKAWFDEKDETTKFSYKAEKTSDFKGLRVIFLKTVKDSSYSLTIEYLWDTQNLAPLLFSNYVWYKDSSWWKGGYYQGEGGQGWQKHIGASDYHIGGNAKSPINLSFENTFTTGEWKWITRWWELLSKCSEENYCRQTLTDIKSRYVLLPDNYYRNKKLNKHTGEFHPLVLLWKEIKPYWKD